MIKQSAYVLALFLGTSSSVSISENFATGMNGDEDLGEDITMKGDKFHFIQNQELLSLMMNAEPAAPATPAAPAAPAAPKAPAAANATKAPSAGTPASKYPAPEKVQTLDPKIAKAHTTFYNGKSKKDGPQDNANVQMYRNGRDISEKGINEDVQDFANANVERLPWPRSEAAFVPNGSKGKFDAAPPVPALYQRYNRDISEKGINEDVQDFANANVERQPWPRSEDAFVPNGSKVTFPAAAPAAFYQRNGRDISEKNIDAEVHGLANSMVDRINWNRSQEPFVPNGSKVTFPAADPAAFYQRNGRDISEKNIDPEVHGLANSMVDRINWNRSQEPFVPNGSQNTFPPAPASFYQRQRNGRDISEKNIDAEVHGLANSMVDRINWNRSQEPFVPNGSKVTFPAADPAAFYQQNKRDIGNGEVRPDVWVTVHNMVDPVAHWRTTKGPKTNYEPWWGQDAEPPLQELEKPKCPEEIEEPVNPMKKKLDKQAKKAKAKKEKEDAEMPGDIEEKKEEKKDEKKDEKKGDAKDEKKDAKDDEKKDEKEGDAKDEKKDDAKDEKKADEKEEKKLAQPENKPPKASLVYDDVNNLWRTQY